MRAVIIFIVLVAAGYWLIAQPWQQRDIKPTPKAKFLFSLTNEAVSESSGVADSTALPGTFWTHNDSGGKAQLFAFDEEGKDLGTYICEGISARDWEDMASVRVNGTSYLYIGDIGDNLKNQREVRVHKFVEPKPGGIDKRIRQIETFRLRYPDGSHNAEALLVTPKGDILIVTKEEKADAGIYELKAPTRPGRHEMTKLGNIKLESGNAYSHMITGGDVAPDGKWVVLRTYFSVLLYQVENPADLAMKRPTSLPAPFERQGEAICFDPKGKRLITTSEGMPCRLSEITLP